MDYESFLGMEGKRAIGAAADAFFVETRRIVTEQGITQASLTVLGGELGKLAKVVYGAQPLAAGERGWSGLSRVLHADMHGLTLVQVRFTSPREVSVVHEHRSWWVLRVINGQEYYTEYDRLDDGKREGYAELRPGPERLLVPGDVLTALEPVIHLHADYQGQTVDELMLLGENPGENPVRRFDPKAKTTFLSPPIKYNSL
jgi:predicted metal-dependent enzyme (double-stranded beta helix superfamily)